MMNKLKNKAKDIRTIFGGVELVANALLVMDKTTTKRVNDVIIIKMEGATDKTVMSMITLKILAVVEPLLGLSPISKLNVCAMAESIYPKKANTKANSMIIFLFMII